MMILDKANPEASSARRTASPEPPGGRPAGAPTPPRPGVFVILEGALVEGNDFGSSSGPIRQVRGAREALAVLQREGYTSVVVTNQSGLALGRFSRSQFSGREALLQQEMRDVGVRLSSFVVCPHMPGIGGRSNCLCRLPAPGMLVRAARANGLDLAASWIVGTDPNELKAGRRAGCRSVQLQSSWSEVVRTVLAARDAMAASR